MKKNFYESHFKGKKITIMGLGVLGRGIKVTQFLAEYGAEVTVTDLKEEKDLAVSLQALKKYNIRYVLGRHDLKDFEDVDMVVKAAGVPLDSPYIQNARKHNIPVVMDASLFARIIQKVEPRITIIGVTGTRGKSMTIALIYHILKQSRKKDGPNVYLGGNMRMCATLPLLRKVQAGDIVVLELDSWQCQGFGDERISPHISVFTNLMPDHMNYYKGSMSKYLKDKSNIFKFQTKDDYLVTNKNTLSLIPKNYHGKILIAKATIPTKGPLHFFGEHNIQNASYAYTVAKQCGITTPAIDKALKSFPCLEGRLEYVKKIKGVSIINDNNATTPEATIAGIKAIKSSKKGDLTLIAGGSDKGLNLADLTLNIKKYCSRVILLPGKGTDRLKPLLGSLAYTEAPTLKIALQEALKNTHPGEFLLFSPGFASFGLFKNEYDRNDQFIKIIKKWK